MTGPIKNVHISGSNAEISWTFFDPSNALERGIWEMCISSFYYSTEVQGRVISIECDLVKNYRHSESLVRVYGPCPLHLFLAKKKQNFLYLPLIWYEINDFSVSPTLALYEGTGNNRTLDTSIKECQLILLYRKKYD